MANRIGIRGRDIDLYVKFTDQGGEAINADSTPKVTITDSDGTVWRTSSSSGISLYENPGIYKLTYSIPDNCADGYVVDLWTAEIGNETISSSFLFYVSSSAQIEDIEKPEYEPGDDVDFEFTQAEVQGLNVLLKILGKRLKNSGTRKVSDGNGGFTDSTCNVFSVDEMTCFLVNSLSEFNQIPHFTSFTFADPSIYGIFADVIIQGAVILALAAQALIEKGREFTVTDNGISFQPPAVSELLNNQYTAQLADYKEKVKFIKCNLKPSPVGLGTFRVSAMSPAYTRLRHLRAKQLI